MESQLPIFGLLRPQLPPPHICGRFNFQYSVSAFTLSQSAVHFESFAGMPFYGRMFHKYLK